MKTIERLSFMIFGGLLVVVGLCLSPYFWVTAENEVFGEITCTGLKVVDSGGKVVGGIFDDEFGGRVYVFGESKSSVGLSFDKSGGIVSVMGNDGKTRAVLMGDGKGAYLGIYAEGRKSPALKMQVDESGASVIRMEKDGTHTHLNGTID